jgi:3-isopropylmalate/(R)-2-methylmalate dehydratase small subunit
MASAFAAPAAARRIPIAVSASSFVCASPVQTTGRAVACRNLQAARGLVMKTMNEVCNVGKKRVGNTITGKVFVCKDNIDTDQIIPAEYLTLVPSNPDEYEKLGSYAMIGLPEGEYSTRYVVPGQTATKYPIIIAGHNFGCGSSREHAPIAIGACGGCAVIAQDYARIFFRNCTATGELYPWESVERLVDHFTTGQTAVIDFENFKVTNTETGVSFELRPLGDVLPVVDAGGIFEFARNSGMIRAAPTS